MKRYRIKIVALCLCIAALTYLKTGSTATNKYPEAEMIKNDVATYQSNIQGFWKEYLSGAIPPSELVATAGGKEISKNFFMWKYKVKLLTNEQEPLRAAVATIKREIFDANLAKERGFYPSEEEISNAVEDLKNSVYATEESTIDFNALIEGMGFNPDDYWDGFAMYGSEIQLLHAKSDEYLQKKGLKYEENAIEFRIVDEAFFEEIESGLLTKLNS